MSSIAAAAVMGEGSKKPANPHISYEAAPAWTPRKFRAQRFGMRRVRAPLSTRGVIASDPWIAGSA
jgi:hypothetical protein